MEAGKTYRFKHQRKGEFTAQFLGEKPCDEQDPVLWHVAIDTRSGSGQERFANAFERDAAGRKVTPAETQKLIRPSLVSVCELVME